MFRAHFGSVTELLDAQPSEVNRELAKWHWLAVEEQRKRDWYGVSSKEEARRILLGGWEEGLVRIKQTISKLELPQIESIRRRPVWRDAGDDLSLDRLYSGDADAAWRTTERRSSPPGLRPCHKIMVDLGSSWKRPAGDFFWRGAAAVALADSLEESGRSCEIVAYNLVGGLNEKSRGQDKYIPDAFLSVTLKRADDPLHLPRIAAMTAHAASLRVGFFRARYTAPYKVRGNHGWSLDFRDPPTEAGDPTLIIRNMYNEEAAKSFLAKVTGKIEGSK